MERGDEHEHEGEKKQTSRTGLETGAATQTTQDKESTTVQTQTEGTNDARGKRTKANEYE